MNRPRLLAFDTSTELMAVALQGAHGSCGSVEAGGARASAVLLPRIHALLAEAGISLADLDAIAFGVGPGAFTGLRTSCAVAQGLGFGLGRPLLAVDSLLIVAEDARLQAGEGGGDFEIGVAMDARMDEVYAGRYRWQGGHWQVLQEPVLSTLAALAPHWGPPPPWVAGSAWAAFGARLGLAASQAVLPTERDRAAALLRLAQALYAAGRTMPAAAALPLYLRDKVAQTTQEREALRGARA
jgi:tRNA threonylcarbamoyladenosine biosynthesis protein TsaB